MTVGDHADQAQPNIWHGSTANGRGQQRRCETADVQPRAKPIPREHPAGGPSRKKPSRCRPYRRERKAARPDRGQTTSIARLSRRAASAIWRTRRETRTRKDAELKRWRSVEENRAGATTKATERENPRNERHREVIVDRAYADRAPVIMRATWRARRRPFDGRSGSGVGSSDRGSTVGEDRQARCGRSVRGRSRPRHT